MCMGYSLMNQGTVLQTDTETLLFQDSSKASDERLTTILDELYANRKSISEENPVSSQSDGVEVQIVIDTPYSGYGYCDKSVWEELKLFADEVKPTVHLTEPN